MIAYEKVRNDLLSLVGFSAGLLRVDDEDPISILTKKTADDLLQRVTAPAAMVASVRRSITRTRLAPDRRTLIDTLCAHPTGDIALGSYTFEICDAEHCLPIVHGYLKRGDVLSFPRITNLMTGLGVLITCVQQNEISAEQAIPLLQAMRNAGLALDPEEVAAQLRALPQEVLATYLQNAPRLIVLPGGQVLLVPAGATVRIVMHEKPEEIEEDPTLVTGWGSKKEPVG